MTSLPVTTHYHDLDPHYTDIYGDPLSRVTNDGVDANNYNLNIYLAPLLAPILTKMGCSNVTTHAGAANLAAAGHSARPGRVVSPQGRHAHGCGQQHLDAEHVPAVLGNSNLFITGESAMPFFDNITAGTHAIGPQAYPCGRGDQEVSPEPRESSSRRPRSNS